jgi:hypothetical protein
MLMSDERRPPGITALSLFFAFGAIITGVMALLVLFPGSITEPAKDSASPLMITLGLLLMIAACVACIVASIGLWKFTKWGLWTALGILCANILSEFSDLITTHQWRTLIGFPLSGVMIWYLWQKKPMFERSGAAAISQNESRSAHTSA